MPMEKITLSNGWVKVRSNLGHLLAVCLGVEGGLCEEDWVLLGCHTQLVVESVMPNLLHVVPVGDDAVLDGVLQCQDPPLALRFISHVAIFLAHADHHTLKHKKSTCTNMDKFRASLCVSFYNKTDEISKQKFFAFPGGQVPPTSKLPEALLVYYARVIIF